MIRICSGWHPAGSIQYGRRFLESFDRYWPSAIQLQVYVEEPEQMPRDAYRDLWSIPGADTMRKMTDDPLYKGLVPNECWKSSAVRGGYNFRFDAAKFWKQILIPQAALSDMANGDILVWLDGDVVTTKAVPVGLVPQLLGKADICFLGREPKHSEIGFWAVRISDKTRIFLWEIARTYSSGAFKELKEWHSAFIWDHVRRRHSLIENDLTPGGRAHVFPMSPVGPFLRHDKGMRKVGAKR